ncbi:MAG: cysteine desulfurase [Bacteroidales bacterium]|nr:cysteine desulfurase [Candidatus Physcousia equi]
MYEISHIREEFPILSRQVYGRPLVYLDNAATTQKPRVVVESMMEEYYNVNANVHRGVHFLSQQATELHEQARETVRRFLKAPSADEVIFTRGTTESINLVAAAYAPLAVERTQGAAPEVIVSALEHHSNIVPWQMMVQRMGGRLRVVPMQEDFTLDIDAYRQLFNDKTVLVAVGQVSNVTGTENPVREMADIAHQHGVPILVDGAQSTPHMAVDVQALDCDFFAFSGHKVYGPTGIGVLWGRESLLDRMPPYMGGGEMIKNVTFDHTTFNDLPFKFEAGTPDYVASTGLARAIDFVTDLGMHNIAQHEQQLTTYARQQMSLIPDMRLFGPETGHSVLSFQVGNIHHLDLGTLLDRLGIAIRTGHHCAEPLMHRLGVSGTARASFALYNTRQEVDTLCNAIDRVRQMF